MASKIKLLNNQGDEVTIEHSDTSSKQGSTVVNIKDITKQVDTIADLKLLDGSHKLVYVTGYHTKGDGAFGSHIFEWDATSTEADNGGTIIKLNSVATGRYKLKYDGAVNVKWFGAKDITITGNENYDSTVNIQSAIDFTPTLGVLSVGYGKYNVNSTLYLKRSILIVGNGYGNKDTSCCQTPQLILGGSVGIEISPDLTFTTQKEYSEMLVGISGVGIRGAGNKSNVGIKCNYFVNGTISRCHISNFDVAIGVNGTWGASVNNNTITDCNYGVVGSVDDARLGYTTFDNVDNFYQINSLKIENNDISHMTYIGVFFYIGMNNLKIQGNNIQNCDLYGIQIASYNGTANGGTPSTGATGFPDQYDRVVGGSILNNYFEKNGNNSNANIVFGKSDASVGYGYQNIRGFIVQANNFNMDNTPIAIDIKVLEESEISNNGYRLGLSNIDFAIANSDGVKNLTLDVERGYSGSFKPNSNIKLNFMKDVSYRYSNIYVSANSSNKISDVTALSAGLSNKPLASLSLAIDFINEFKYLTNGKMIKLNIGDGDYTSDGILDFPESNYYIGDIAGTATDGAILRGLKFTNSKIYWNSNLKIKIHATTNRGIELIRSEMDIYKANITSDASNLKSGIFASRASSVLIYSGTTIDSNFSYTIRNIGSIVFDESSQTNTITVAAGRTFN